jgi:hypothetical protein
MPDYAQLWDGKRGEDAHVKCIGIRGAYDPDGVNELGIYDDDIILMIGDEVTEWKGSTDPGRCYIQHPENPHGCAQLKEGIHMFKEGLHQGRFPAFVQAESFHVNRLDRGGPGADVGVYSAGCQIISSPEGYFGATWHSFFDPAVAAMNDVNQRLLPYMLIDENDLE